MKRKLTTASFLVLMVVLAYWNYQQTTALAADDNWFQSRSGYPDFEKARELARSTGKPLLILVR